ncbi:uncharacterized protein LOC113237783 [Hyposmocoma kahamanoa]|uniref:uncharacterized protein LOC113237783 n=1 Tax=Hyposmocoma kahamanoa TaxID=1477025 RepID=UPI000E6D882F|nr:uncharacterized protein LOC113237783 [Hyposmocoma kahamanoa]
MPFHWLPNLRNCCYCITNLRTATIVIAVLGIVTSPAVSWSVVRHAYVIRVSCYVSTNESKPDVIDINLNNMLSFGFGANAGLGPSCLYKSSVENLSSITTFKLDDRVSTNHGVLKIIMYIGWVVLLGDLIFVICCIVFLFKLAKGREMTFLKALMWTCIVAITLTFIYGLMFVVTCLVTGGKFPVFEFIFTLFDLGIWIYFLIVVNSYRRSGMRTNENATTYNYEHPSQFLTILH